MTLGNFAATVVTAFVAAAPPRTDAATFATVPIGPGKTEATTFAILLKIDID